jgi:hypothetical protein
MGRTVVDELYERYRQLSHAELYRQLGAGSPAQVEALTTVWRRVEEALQALTAGLGQDLLTLQQSWTGVGSQEYQYRLGLAVTWAEALRTEAAAIRTGLSLMAGMLADAQRRAEPDPDDGGEWAFDGLLGPALGHSVPAAEKARAHERLARLVAELAAGYGIVDHRTWPAALPDVPVDLPGEGVPGVPVAGSVGAVIQRAGEDVGLVDDSVPAAPPPAAPPLSSSAVPGASMLAGAGSGLAAAHTGHLVDHASYRGTTEATAGSAAGQAPVAPMMGGGAPGAAVSPAGTVGGYHRPFEDDTSWLTGEQSLWVEASDEPPPSVLGDSA